MNRRRLVTLAVAMAIALAGSYGVFALSSNGTFGTTSERGTHFVTDGDSLTLEADSEQVVRGESDRPTGTNLSVRLRSDTGAKFIYASQATVDESGEFRTTFDLSGISEETEFNASVRAENGTRLANTTGTVET